MGNGMSIGGYGYDPYFMQAYMYNNPNYLAQLQAMQTLQAQQSQQAGSQTTNTQAQASKVDKKKDHTAGLIVGTVLTVGAALLCRKAYKAGNGAKFFDKMGDGFKSLYDGVKSKFGSVVNPEKLSIAKNGGKSVCTVPNRTNMIREDVTRTLTDIGESAAAVNISKDALQNGSQQLRNFTYTDGNKVIKVVKGNVVEYIRNGRTFKGDSSKKLVEQLSETEYSKLTQIVNDCMKGENLDKITDITFSQKANGVSKLFTTAKADEAAAIKAAVTKKFSVSSDAVKAYCHEHPSVEEAIKNFVKGETKDWRMHKGEYEIKNVGTLLFKDNDIVGIKVGETVYGTKTDKYKALFHDNEQAFKSALEHKDKFKNVIWQM